jgi:tyrosinase
VLGGTIGTEMTRTHAVVDARGTRRAVHTGDARPLTQTDRGVCAMTTQVRREVRALGPGWPETLLWYEKAVRVLQSRPLDDRTSWRFLAAMHGLRPASWIEFGIVGPGDTPPPAAEQRRFWNQCQHQSWYFLPWHRGYLSAFERIIRAAVVTAGGPGDWALPYWNYSDTTAADARVLPDAFASPTLADGSANALFVERRYGAGATPIVLPPEDVLLTALDDDQFTGGADDIPPGFGGPMTLFHHGPESETTNGSLESSPHNALHGAIGGSKPGEDRQDWRNWGLMTTPSTAALDPIFWLHHANIDRLWSVWLRGNVNPEDEGWLDGPADRTFVMPKADGDEWEFSAADVLDTTAAPLEYAYDDEERGPEPPLPGGDRRERRLRALGVAPRTPSEEVHGDEGAGMGQERAPELIGASGGSIHVAGETGAELRMDKPRAEVLSRGLRRAIEDDADAVAEPPRVFLKLEGIRGTSDAANYYVYVDMPSGADRSEYADRLAGTLSLFGVTAASDEEGPNAGNGLNQVLEITRIVDALQLSGRDLETIDVRFVPADDAVAAVDFSIRRVGVYVLEQ